MGNKPGDESYPERPDAIGKKEMRLMNSSARKWLLRYWDFPLFAALLRKHGISLTTASVLDAGCGSGYSLTLISDRFKPRELTGFDIVPSQVERARSRGTPATVLVADITALDLQSASFDAVFVLGVLHHCREWRAGLAEISRVMKDSGILLLEEPGTRFLRFERLLARRSPSLETGFSLRNLRAEMARNGLSVVESRALYFGLFRSFLCVKGAGVRSTEQYVARHMLRTPDPRQITPEGQEAPA